MKSNLFVICDWGHIEVKHRGANYLVYNLLSFICTIKETGRDILFLKYCLKWNV